MEMSTRFSHNDILFLLETLEPRLVNRSETAEGNPTLVDGMMEQEAGSLSELCFSVKRRWSELPPCFSIISI